MDWMGKRNSHEGAGLKDSAWQEKPDDGRAWVSTDFISKYAFKFKYFTIKDSGGRLNGHHKACRVFEASSSMDKWWGDPGLQRKKFYESQEQVCQHPLSFIWPSLVPIRCCLSGIPKSLKWAENISRVLPKDGVGPSALKRVWLWAD